MHDAAVPGTIVGTTGRESLFDPGSLNTSSFDDFLAMEAHEESSSDSSTSSQVKRPLNRKRKTLADLSPLELLKTREINRLAAQRHRMLAKQKRVEQAAKLSAIVRSNDALRAEINQMKAELNTLRKVVVSVYAQPGGSARLKLLHFA